MYISRAVRNARPLMESPAGWTLPVPFSHPGNGAQTVPLRHWEVHRRASWRD